jgi:primosomal replication protein N''
MPIGEISDLLATRRPMATPRDYLQAYFEYARTLSAGELEAAGALLSRLVAEQQSGRPRWDDEKDGFQTTVGEFLAALGVRAVPVRDSGAFGLDFAIEDPRTGYYGLGIECDAPRHPLLAHARAREIWRPAMLRRSIPQVHRVSSQGWYHDGERERQRLREAIEQLRSAAGPAPGAPHPERWSPDRQAVMARLSRASEAGPNGATISPITNPGEPAGEGST